MTAKMWDIFETLEGPRLVADFQRLCGVIPRPKSRKPIKTKSNGLAVHCNGVTNGTVTTDNYQNGDVGGHGDNVNEKGHVYNLRSRTILPTETEIEPTSNSSMTPPPAENTVDQNAAESDDDSEGWSTTSETDREDSKKKDLLTDYDIARPFLYYLFCFGANLGNEIFYCAMFPFWFWNVDGFVGRRICYVWCIIMYFGQAAKDVIRWPRPASPPVVRMENRYELEYGMPSTHAMVGLAVPFALLVFTWNRYEYEHVSACVFGVAWCILVCTSRLYLGMHTVLDVIAGLLFSALILSILHPLLDSLDTFILTERYSPVAVVIVSLLMCLCYPNLDKWSTARGDTTMILAVGVGVCLGSWANYQLETYQVTTDLPPYTIKLPHAEYFGMAILRTLLGIAILVATRTFMKASTYHYLCRIFGYRKDEMSLRHLIVELPYKYITYTAVAFNVVYFAPALFRYIGIERITLHTEY